MQAVWYERNGLAREVLQFGEMTDPEPGPGEVRVHIHASGVNPSDWKTRSGSRPMIAPRVIPHSDGAGIIDRIGAGVDPARIGERVWIWNGQWKRAFGTAATYIAVPSEQAVRLPDAVAFEAGACLGIPALTAHRAITTDGSPEGQIIIVAGSAGGGRTLCHPDGEATWSRSGDRHRELSRERGACPGGRRRCDHQLPDRIGARTGPRDHRWA